LQEKSILLPKAADHEGNCLIIS